jgi:hypothetical protein
MLFATTVALSLYWYETDSGLVAWIGPQRMTRVSEPSRGGAALASWLVALVAAFVLAVLIGWVLEKVTGVRSRSPGAEATPPDRPPEP